MPAPEPTTTISNADIAAAKRMWRAAQARGCDGTEVDATYRWYLSLIAGQARQIREEFWQRELPAGDRD